MAITYRPYFNAIQKETMPDIIKYLNNNKVNYNSYLQTDALCLTRELVVPRCIASTITYCLIKPLVIEPFDQGTPLFMGHLFVLWI